MCALWTETLSPAIYSGAQGVVKQAWPKAALVYNTIIIAGHYHYLIFGIFLLGVKMQPF